MKRRVWWSILVTLTVILGGWLVISQGIRDNASKQYQKTKVPTLFIHGFGSSHRAEEHMVNAIVKVGVTQNVIRATIAKDGKVTLSGAWPQSAYNPLVEVEFKDNRNPNYRKNSEGLKNVLENLQKTYGIDKFNVVAHSMGNLTLAYYMLDNGQNKKLPQLQKQVNIAGHYDGIIGWDDKAHQIKLDKDGRPEKMNSTYKELLKLQETYPKDQVSVLNIYGDLDDGSDSDGRVSNNSSRSEKYLLKGRYKSYQELEIKGKKGQHSQLHENAQVDKALINFLWKK